MKVNGHFVTELGHKITPANDRVEISGKVLQPEKHVYYILNKPKNMLTTTDDPEGRQTVMQLFAGKVHERIYPVGRLDRNTTGLLILTNDGQLTAALSHPSHEVRKLYYVRLERKMPLEDLQRIAQGLTLDDGFIRPDKVDYVDGSDGTDIGIELHSGRNRIVRRIFEHLGYRIVALDRVAYGPLTKKSLPRGTFRALTPQEVGFLYMEAGKNGKGKPRGKKAVKPARVADED